MEGTSEKVPSEGTFKGTFEGTFGRYLKCTFMRQVKGTFKGTFRKVPSEGTFKVHQKGTFKVPS